MERQNTMYALFGNPVAHSLSPAMHQAAYDHMGIHARYLAFCPRDAGEAMELIRRHDIAGASVTVPFKIDIMAYLDRIETGAGEIGAVNTVCRREGKLVGYNTDWQGFVADLKTHMDIAGRTFVVLGAGGAARAVLYGLLKEGGKAMVVNRTGKKAAMLADEFGCSWLSYEDMAVAEGDCLVNTTSVGLSPHGEASPVERSILPRFRSVVDIIYNPIKTRLLRDAEASGCVTHNGLGMFIHQGAEQIRLWTGKEPPLSVMRRTVLERFKEP